VDVEDGRSITTEFDTKTTRVTVKNVTKDSLTTVGILDMISGEKKRPLVPFTHPAMEIKPL
jgi:hypothetical protein